MTSIYSTFLASGTTVVKALVNTVEKADELSMKLSVNLSSSIIPEIIRYGKKTKPHGKGVTGFSSYF
ncbi:unnamed protein product [Acanthoscelides obtectus]|uniref:Uncharacterized protein n=1 Tax=Acanthoscelides obtectus TaxID=200917 RepID=A0A9P0KEY8_ACAOB|nr:unnamed protein product [Acanthoscelides obtectus]CAK1667454.1 hypothetical protein AOBTE_LOCUS25852 [Acanthoscelides obtectus]